MSTPAPCRHLHTRARWWVGDGEPETGYHEDGTQVECTDCGEIFTEGEFQQELELIEKEPQPPVRAPKAGDFYYLFGMQLLVLRVNQTHVSYCNRYETKRGKRSGPVIHVPLERFLDDIACGQLVALEEMLA